MHQLWFYQNYVDNLKHSNNLVRRWAFETIKERFPRRFTPEVAMLIGDSDEHLACSVPKYLARFSSVEHAPAILQSFLKDKGNVPGNCAIALGDMRYKPAVDTILNRINHCKDINTLLGILHYLGKIHQNDCHITLRKIFQELADDYYVGAAAAHLLEHQDPEDISLVLETYLRRIQTAGGGADFLDRVMGSLGAAGLYDYLTKHGSKDLLKFPREALEELMESHPLVDPSLETVDELIRLVEKRRYQDIATSLMFHSREIVRSRISEIDNKERISEMLGQDRLCMAFLEYVSKQSGAWDLRDEANKFERDLLSALIACYFSILSRESYLKALDPAAGPEELIHALKGSGPELPIGIQNRLVELAPVQEFKAVLTPELATWGDIWTVRLMGRIGGEFFVPELIRTIQESDGLDHIHADAIEALNGMDESGHESLLTAIQEGEFTDALDVFSLLEHLPYSESFPIVLRYWNEGEVDSSEIYAICLERIGDIRGIEALQKIFYEEDVDFIGDSLELLSVIHNKNIPELTTIRHEREARRARYAKHQQEWNRLGTKLQKENVIELTPRRSGPKVGRNSPCPCGSGKKYKKCCLNKE